MSRIWLEACVTSVAAVRVAWEEGADRVELCRKLSVGGLTPDLEVVAEASQVPIPVHVLIRCRAGDFHYAASEIQEMGTQMNQSVQCGASGIVLGALTAGRTVDRAALRRWKEALEQTGLPFPAVTFHRAFDEVADPEEALSVLEAEGWISRVLTSGGAPTALEGRAALGLWQSSTSLTVLAAGGVRPENVAELLGGSRFHGEDGVHEVHFNAMLDEEQADRERLRELRRLVDQISG